MLLDIKDLKCTPNIISPAGEAITLGFKANSAEPTHLRARYWIADQAPFEFRAGSTRTKEVFFPSRTGKDDAPFTWRNWGEKATHIVPEGQAVEHTAPLKVNLDVLGFVDNRQIGTEHLDIFVTIDTLRENTLGDEASALSMALRIVHSDVQVSKRRIAEILSSGVGRNVSADLVARVIDGGSSTNLLEVLRGK